MSEPTWSERYGMIVASNRREQRLTQRALAGIAHVEVEVVQLIEAGGIQYVEEVTAYRISRLLGLSNAVDWYAYQCRF